MNAVFTLYYFCFFTASCRLARYFLITSIMNCNGWIPFVHLHHISLIAFRTLHFLFTYKWLLLSALSTCIETIIFFLLQASRFLSKALQFLLSWNYLRLNLFAKFYVISIKFVMMLPLELRLSNLFNTRKRKFREMQQKWENIQIIILLSLAQYKQRQNARNSKQGQCQSVLMIYCSFCILRYVVISFLLVHIPFEKRIFESISKVFYFSLFLFTNINFCIFHLKRHTTIFAPTKSNNKKSLSNIAIF